MTHGAWAGVPHVSSPQCSTSSREAEGLHRRALEGFESQLGPQHPDTLTSVNNLAFLLSNQGKLEEARPRSLGCREVAFLALSRGRHFSCGQDETGEFSLPSFTGAIWECELMPRLMYGQILIWVWWGSISRQGELLEIECWTALLLVNLLWNYWVNHQRHGPSKSEGLDYLTILSGGKYRSFSWHLVLNSKSAWRTLGIVCSHYSPKIVAFVGLFFPFHDTWGLSWGSSHVSTPQRSISSREAEGLYRRALEGREPQLGPQHPHTLNSANNLACLLEKQGKLEEAGLRSLGLGARRGCGSVEGKAVLEWPGQGTGEFLVSKFHRSNLKILFMRREVWFCIWDSSW